MLEEGEEKRLAVLESQHNKELDALKSKYTAEQQATEEYKQLEAEVQAKYEADKTKIAQEEAEKRRQASLKEVQDYAKYGSDMLSATANILGSIAQSYENEYHKIVDGKEELSAQEKEQAVKALERQKQATIAQLALQQAMSIGNAILAATAAAAVSSVAAPVVYAATAATITAGIISSMMQAKNSISNIDKQIEDVKNLATGGYVEGPGSSTSDSIPARLSNGESVINARSTAMYYDLLSRINQAGGGVAFPDTRNTPILHFARGGIATQSEQITNAVKTAMENYSPVVSVREITRMQNRVRAKELS